MTPVAWIALLGAGAYVYKKKPQWIPAAIRPKSLQKDVALAKVAATTKSTPHAGAGMDPGMTSAQVAAANGMLTSATDPSPVYAMASDYSGLGFVKTSEALIAKAEALAEARKHGAEDDELLAQMRAASSHPSASAQQAFAQAAQEPGINPGEEFGSSWAKNIS